MKISKIVSATLFGAVLATGAYADASIDRFETILKDLQHAIDADAVKLSEITKADNTIKDEYANFRAFMYDLALYVKEKTLADLPFKTENEALILGEAGKPIAKLYFIGDATDNNSKISVVIAKAGEAKADKFYIDSTNKLIAKANTGATGWLTVAPAVGGELEKDDVEKIEQSAKEQLLKLLEAKRVAALDAFVETGTVVAENATFLSSNYDSLIPAYNATIADKKTALDAAIAKFKKDDAQKDNIVLNEAGLADQIAAIVSLASSGNDELLKITTPSTETIQDITKKANQVKKALNNGLKFKATDDDKIVTVAMVDEILTGLSDANRQEKATALSKIIGADTNAAALKAINNVKTALTTGQNAIQASVTAYDTAVKNKEKSLEVLAGNAATSFVKGQLESGAKDAFETFADLVKEDKDTKALTATQAVLQGKTYQQVIAQYEAAVDAQDTIKSADNLIDTADKKPKTNKLKEGLKKAVAAGIKFTHSDKNIDNLTAQELAAAVANANTNLTAQLGDAQTNNTLAKVAAAAKKIKEYENVSNLRVQALTEQKIVANTQTTVGLSLADISIDNKSSYELFAEAKDSFVRAVKTSTTGIEQTAKTITQTQSLDLIKNNTELATKTRLAKLSNPFSADIALASAILNLKADSLADSGDSLSSVVKAYSDRANQDNNIWASILGAKSKVKGATSPSVWGLTLGYDKAFDSTIVGAYINYAKSSASSELLNAKADSYNFGLYSRSFIDNHEIDAKLSYGFANNKLDRRAYSNTQTFKQDAKFKSSFYGLGFEYGYITDLSESLFVKPLLGLEYSYLNNKAFSENGNLPVNYSGAKSKELSANLGVELRKYVSNGNFIYITPSIEFDLLKKTSNVTANFVGSSRNITLANDAKKRKAGFAIKTGANLKLTENLSTDVNFGAKLKKDEKHYNGTVGLRYAF